MKIDLLEPSELNVSTTARIKKIHLLLKQLGHEVVEQKCDPLLFEHVCRDHPSVVFNLASIYGWGKSNLVPAVLEIAGVRYTGSGMLGLSLARNYSKLFPLLLNKGVLVPPFQVLESDQAALLNGLEYPLRLYRDWEKQTALLNNPAELNRALKKLPVHEKFLLMEPILGKRVSFYLLDGEPFLGKPLSDFLVPAQKANRILEAKGLVRFDFILGNQAVLEGIEIAPDPLDEDFLHEAARAGWDASRILQALIINAGSDLLDPIPQPILES